MRRLINLTIDILLITDISPATETVAFCIGRMSYTNKKSFSLWIHCILIFLFIEIYCRKSINKMDDSSKRICHIYNTYESLHIYSFLVYILHNHILPYTYNWWHDLIVQYHKNYLTATFKNPVRGRQAGGPPAVQPPQFIGY